MMTPRKPYSITQYREYFVIKFGRVEWPEYGQWEDLTPREQEDTIGYLMAANIELDEQLEQPNK